MVILKLTKYWHYKVFQKHIPPIDGMKIKENNYPISWRHFLFTLRQLKGNATISSLAFLTEADAELILHQNTEIAHYKACTSHPRISVQNSKTVKGSTGPFKLQKIKKHDKLFQNKKKKKQECQLCTLNPRCHSLGNI
jgi:hypothetical protein